MNYISYNEELKEIENKLKELTEIMLKEVSILSLKQHKLQFFILITF